MPHLEPPELEGADLAELSGFLEEADLAEANWESGRRRRQDQERKEKAKLDAQARLALAPPPRGTDVHRRLDRYIGRTQPSGSAESGPQASPLASLSLSLSLSLSRSLRR